LINYRLPSKHFALTKFLEAKMNSPTQRIDEEKLFTSTIWRHFSVLQDPRVQDNQKYSFRHLIIAIVCSMICGASDIEAIVNYIDSKMEWLREALGMTSLPSYKTIWWLLVLMNPEELNRAFMNFVEEARQTLCPESQLLESIAIDGKTSRGTARDGIKALHTVSAWSSALQLLLGQVKTDEKSNEITAIPKLLKLLDLEGKVVTIDAMGCQASIADQIVEGGGHYILALKGNQETIHEEVREIFVQKSNSVKNLDLPEVHMEEACEIDKGHGRLEERTVRVSTDVDWLKKEKKWKSVNSLIEITAHRTIKGRRSTEKRYYLSSLEAKAKEFLKWIRDHWGVESFHWTLDVAFADDNFQGHTGHLAENFSLLQRLTLTLLKQETSIKKSIPKKRDRAGWNNKYLLKVLGV
jgi:predicted transposase YbfD/YdcC